MERVISLVGLVVLVGLAWLLSERKKKIDYKLVVSGIGLQFFLGIIVLWTEPGRAFFEFARHLTTKIISFANEGSKMVFGEDFTQHFFAFSVLPTIIFISSLMAILFHLGLLQRLVDLMAKIMVKVMKVSGSESLAASANIFVGQTEAPLVIKPYVHTMTRSEIMAMMTGGFATVSGGILAAYVSFGADPGHLLAASLMSAPASLVIAKILIPETQSSKTLGRAKVKIVSKDENILDAACRGASEGLYLCLNVAAMVIAFVALAALINFLFSLLPELGGTPLTLERILGWLFFPIALLMGAPPNEAVLLGGLFGKKMFLNEFLAYMDLSKLKDQLSPRSFTLATYALCGFANFSSIAMQIGGLGILFPERRKDFAQLAFKAMLGGSIAAFMTANVAGILIK